MKTEFSKLFIKSAKKLSGKYKEALRVTILEVEKASTIQELCNCKKLVGFDKVYRIRIGNYRAFFLFTIIDDTVYFEYLVPRGEAYKKENIDNLREKDK